MDNVHGSHIRPEAVIPKPPVEVVGRYGAQAQLRLMERQLAATERTNKALNRMIDLLATWIERLESQ
jgi:hypothetical protein